METGIAQAAPAVVLQDICSQSKARSRQHERKLELNMLDVSCANY